MFGKTRAHAPESENVTTAVEVFHQHGDGSLGEEWKLFSPAVWECLAVRKTFLVDSFRRESGCKWKICKLKRYIFCCSVLKVCITFNVPACSIFQSYCANQFHWRATGRKITHLHVGSNRQLAFCIFFFLLTGLQIRCWTNKALRYLGLPILYGCGMFHSRRQAEGINQEKRLLCQAATVWWSTYCQPCLHIIACSIVKVELTLLLSLV